MEEKRIFAWIDREADRLITLSDDIHDHPELSGKEYYACDRLVQVLAENGFSVERGVGGMETSFRAVWHNGTGGPNLGLLCEYDALPEIGHGCGHHAQGPAILGAALALKAAAGSEPFTVTVYGTPAEETLGGKIVMQQAGCFSELDVALMFHGGDSTCVDVKSMALSSFRLRFHGISAHAAMAPEKGRSALDALLLTFHGIEFLREHVREDTRMHYTVTNGGGTDNVVPELAEGTVTLRSYNRAYLDTVVERFRKIVQGAELMTETTAELIEDLPFDSKIPVLSLNRLLMEKAEALDAPNIRPPRQKTGSTDFGNVMFRTPGSCIRVAFVPEGTSAHTETYVEYGTRPEMHRALVTAAKILAAACCDMIYDPQILADIQAEFREAKARLEA